MKCSRCGAEMKIKNVKVDTDMHGNPVYQKYAYCYHCKIRRSLSRHKSSSGSSAKRPSKSTRRRKKKHIFLTVMPWLLIVVVIAGGCFFFIQRSRVEDARKKETVVTKTRKNLITADAFSQLKTGMTLNEVKGIIGTDGSRLLQTSNDTSTTERYQWLEKDGNGTVLLSFIDEKLVSLSQTGMETENSSSLSPEAVGALKPEMSLEEVNASLGVNGVRISETAADGVTTSLYQWSDDGAADHKISVVFIDDGAAYINEKLQDTTTEAATSSEIESE